MSSDAIPRLPETLKTGFGIRPNWVPHVTKRIRQRLLASILDGRDHAGFVIILLALQSCWPVQWGASDDGERQAEIFESARIISGDWLGLFQSLETKQEANPMIGE